MADNPSKQAELYDLIDASTYKVDERHGFRTIARKSPSCIARTGRPGSMAILRNPEHRRIRASC